jgi:hypothetical protein
MHFVSAALALLSILLTVDAIPANLTERRSLAQVITRCTKPNTVALTFDDGPYVGHSWPNFTNSALFGSVNLQHLFWELLNLDTTCNCLISTASSEVSIVDSKTQVSKSNS